VDKVLDDAMITTSPTLPTSIPFPTPSKPTTSTIPVTSSAATSITERLEPERLPSDSTIVTTTMEEVKDTDVDLNEKGWKGKVGRWLKCWVGGKKRRWYLSFLFVSVYLTGLKWLIKEWV